MRRGRRDPSLFAYRSRNSQPSGGASTALHKYLLWMQQAGLSNVDCVWKHFARAVVYGELLRKLVVEFQEEDGMSMDSSEIVWRPDPETASRTRIARFMQQHGFSSIEALQQRSVEDIAWYWDAVSRDLSWQWSTPYRQVVDTSRGIQWPRWFVDGRTNLAANCVDKHLTGWRRDEVALISEADDGSVRTLTFAALADEVGRLANALTRLGVRAQRYGGGVFTDVSGGGYRRAGHVTHWGCVHAMLLRIWRPGCGHTLARL